jgi:hypothetical protein
MGGIVHSTEFIACTPTDLLKYVRFVADSTEYRNNGPSNCQLIINRLRKFTKDEYDLSDPEGTVFFKNQMAVQLSGKCRVPPHGKGLPDKFEGGRIKLF